MKRLCCIVSFILLIVPSYALSATIISLSEISTKPDSEAVVTLALTNTVSVRGMQFIVTISPDAGIDLDSIWATGRAEGFDVRFSQASGRTNVMVFIISNSVISSGEGDILKFNFKVLSTTTIGSSFILNIGSVKIVDENSNALTDVTIIPGKIDIKGGPDISVDPQAIDFGEVPIGESKKGSFYIKNEGDLELLLYQIQISDPAVFSISPFTNAIPSKQIILVNVNFTPSALGFQSGTLTIQSNDDDESSFIVAVSGVGISPELSLGDSILDFGDVLLNQSKTDSILIMNEGTDELQISRITSNNSNYFTVKYPSLNIPKGTSAWLPITFRPITSGTYNTMIVLQSNDIDEGLVNIYVNGRGVEIPKPVFYVDDKTINFGDVIVGSGKSDSVQIRNNGSADLQISNIKSNSTSFQAVQMMPTIQPGKTAWLQISFRPLQVQNYSSTVTFQTNDSSKINVSIEVTGRGISLAPQIKLSANQLNFMNVVIDSTKTLELTIQNIGNANLRLYEIRSSEPTTFKVSESSVANISPYDSHSVYITFFPKEEKQYSASLAITCNDTANASNQISLSGNGVATSPLPPSSSDLDGNGKTDVFDLLSLLKVISGTPNSGNSCDVNCDGKVDIFDLLDLLKYLAGDSGNNPGEPSVPDTVVVNGITLVSIPGGTFQMGQSGVAEPVHSVTVSSFLIGKYEITQSQYKAVMESNPSYFTGDLNRPVEMVSWYDAAKFCNKLSELASLQQCYNLSTWVCDYTKNGFRLPTQAEWEYACRAGTTTNYYTGDWESDLSKAGWYAENSDNTTHAVGVKQANDFGLYDMHGNVWERCNDWFGDYNSECQTNPTGPAIGSARILRGGSWYNPASSCLAVSISLDQLIARNHLMGFRIVRGNFVPTTFLNILASSVTSGNSYTLGWNKVPGALNYTIEEATDSSFGGAISATITDTTLQYNHTTSESITLYYRVRVNSAIGSGEWSNTSTVNVSPLRPIEMVSIPGGTFQMGQIGIAEPVHTVTISTFKMSKFEITQYQYQNVIGSNPSYYTGNLNRPVEMVSWYEAATFCNYLSEVAGLQPCYNLTTWDCDFTKNGYRLPTEAEWEYACRAGTSNNYYTGDSEADLEKAGWYSGNSGGTTHAVGGKQANSFSLYDMHGNVMEWCYDRWESYSSENAVDPQGPATSYTHILRGGAWNFSANDCRSAFRNGGPPEDRGRGMGFRVVHR